MDQPNSKRWGPFKRKPPNEEEQDDDGSIPSFLEKAKPFCIALVLGGRTRRTLRVLFGILPLYFMFLFVSEELKFAFVSFAMTLQYIALCYQAPSTFGAASIIEVSIFLGLFIGCLFTSFVLVLCVSINVYVAYMGIILCILFAEPTFTSASIPPFLSILPWIILDSTLISNLTDILDVNDVQYVGALWTGSLKEATLKNFIISASLAVGFGLFVYLIPPVSSEFARLYNGTSVLLSSLSKQFISIADAFRAPEAALRPDLKPADPLNLNTAFEDGQDRRAEEIKVAGIITANATADCGNRTSHLPEPPYQDNSGDLTWEPIDTQPLPLAAHVNKDQIDHKAYLHASKSTVAPSIIHTIHVRALSDIEALDLSQPMNISLESQDASATDFTVCKSAQSTHYERILAQLNNSSANYETTRTKVRRTTATILSAKAEIPIHTPIPVPKQPCSGFAHTCEPALWRLLLDKINQTNRDGHGFSQHVSFILAGYILNQDLLSMIGDMLECYSRILGSLSSGLLCLTGRSNKRIREESRTAETKLKDEQDKQKQSSKALRDALWAKHKEAFFRRKAVISNPNATIGYTEALKRRLTAAFIFKRASSLDLDGLTHHELLDLLLRHYYESSIVSFLFMLGGVRVNAESKSLVANYKQVVSKSLNRSQAEEMKAFTDFLLIIPMQLARDYWQWFVWMYSGLIPFSFSACWLSFKSYWKSNRGRHAFKVFFGLSLIYAPSLFSSTYRTLFNLGHNGRFGAWQIQAFIASLQTSVEATMKKVVWGIVGNAVGGLVAFVMLYLTTNAVALFFYLVVITVVTTWILNGSDEHYFTFTIQFGYAVNSFGVINLMVVGSAGSFESTRDLAIFLATRVVSQTVGTSWALIVSMLVFPNFAYDRAYDLALNTMNCLIDQIAHQSVDIYLGFNDTPVDCQQEFERCEQTVQSSISMFQQARKDIEAAERYGILKFLGIWFYDGGEADAILNWSASVLTCVEGMYHLSLRSSSTTMGEYRSMGCIYRTDSEWMKKVGEIHGSDTAAQREACMKLINAVHDRFDAIVHLMQYYTEVKSSQELRGWKARWRKMGNKAKAPQEMNSPSAVSMKETSVFTEFEQSQSESDPRLGALKANMLNRIFEFWIALLEFEQTLMPFFERDDFDVWYTDIYRFDAFLGFLRRLEDLMMEIPT